MTRTRARRPCYGVTASPPASRDLEVLGDEHLVGRALAGERGAFNVLVVRHEARLFRFLSRMTPNAADVEDAMQHAFVKAYRKLGTFNPRYRFTTWLFTIAARELRAVRRRSAVAAGPLIDGKDPAAPVEADHAPGDLWAAARRLLTVTQFTTMWLRYGEDLAVAEVAQVMGRPRVWVSVTLHRACAAMRKALGEEDPTTLVPGWRGLENGTGGRR